MQLWVPHAQAMQRDALTLGAGGLYRSPQEGRGFVLAELDVLELLGVRLEAAAGGTNYRPVGVVWAGPTLSLDVWTWAPAVFAGVGWRYGPDHALAGTVRVELRRYLSLHAGLGVGVGVEWARHQPAQLAASLAYFYRL
jgi:hypothetical protein